MSSLRVYDISGAEVGEVEFPDALLVRRGGQAVQEAVVAHRANCRAGTASTLRKGEVAGSGRKPWRQKGTGRARSGYRQSPVWRGGGVAFGPHPRDYSVKLPRKVERLAFRRAFSMRVEAGAVRVLAGLEMREPKTRLVQQMLKALSAPKALIVVEREDRNLWRATRNMTGVAVGTPDSIHTYQLLRHPLVLITRAALERLQARLSEARKGAA